MSGAELTYGFFCFKHVKAVCIKLEGKNICAVYKRSGAVVNRMVKDLLGCSVLTILFYKLIKELTQCIPVRKQQIRFQG